MRSSFAVAAIALALATSAQAASLVNEPRHDLVRGQVKPLHPRQGMVKRAKKNGKRNGRHKAKRSGPSKQEYCAAQAASSSLAAAASTSSPAPQATPQTNNSNPVGNVNAVDPAPAANADVSQPAASDPAPTPDQQQQDSQPQQNSNPAPASSSSGDDGLTQDQQDQFVTLHNNLRAQHGAAPLTWDPNLASIAKGWADGCVFQHSGGKLGPYGENLAAGTGSSYDVNSGFTDWANEASQYNPASPDPSHFTQIVWKGTTSFGCGEAPACNGIFPSGTATYFVCEYFPQGNVIGDFAQNVQA